MQLFNLRSKRRIAGAGASLLCAVGLAIGAAQPAMALDWPPSSVYGSMTTGTFNYQGWKYLVVTQVNDGALVTTQYNGNNPNTQCFAGSGKFGYGKLYRLGATGELSAKYLGRTCTPIVVGGAPAGYSQPYMMYPRNR